MEQRREEAQLVLEQKGAHLEEEQETEKAQCQLMRTLKEQEMGREEHPLSREQLLEKTVVRDRADILGRKGTS